MSRDLAQQIIAEADDVQIVLNGVASTNLATLECKWVAANDEVWMRFQGTQIPRGSKIVSAKLRLIGKSSSGTTTVNFQLEAAGNSAQPTLSDTPTSRTWGSVAANQWAMPAWADLSVNDSPDLSDILQELVRRSDWTGDDPSFGDLMFRLKVSAAGAKGSQRTAYAFDHNNNGIAPELLVTYTPPPPPQGRIIG